MPATPPNSEQAAVIPHFSTADVKCANTNGPQCAHDSYGYPYPNSPDCDEGATLNGCVIDTWRFYQGQCTSWVAYRLSQLNGISFSNSYGGQGTWGDATNWGSHARGLGITVDGTPAPGSVAWWSSSHVAYVEQVNSPTSIVISEMNYDFHNGFWVHTITTTTGWPSGFIHIHDAATSSLTDGAFVVSQDNGRVYRIVGGAPIYVSNWAVYGGAQPTTPMSQASIDALPRYPADGTFVTGSAGYVYRVAGGAPVYVGSWNAVGGPQPSLLVDQASIENAGGGAPWDHLRMYPADGTFVDGAGTVFRFAGGAPIAVSDWKTVGGIQPYTVVDTAALANGGLGAPWNHVRAVPADGTFIRGSADGAIYRVVGGAPVYVSTWDAVGGPQAAVGVDQGAIANAGGGGAWSHLRNYPSDGSFVIVNGGAVYRIAGGAALWVRDWAPFGGAQPVTLIDQAAIDNADAASPWNHLHRFPAAGTVVEGLPTGSYWQSTGTCVSSAPASSSSVSLNDATANDLASCAPPIMASYTPMSAISGTSITLTGQGFAGATAVSLCFVPSSFRVVSGTSITATVPEGACSGRWRVSTAAGVGVSDGAFTVVPVPSLSWFGPSGSSVGGLVSLVGSNLSAASSVSLCFVEASFTVVSAGRVDAVVPPGACDGRWRVTTPGGTAVSDGVFRTRTPDLRDVAPLLGPVGSTVTISGSGFSNTSSVSLCLVPAAFTLVSENTITATVPAGACNGRWRVTNSDATGTYDPAFTINAPQTSSSAPAAGPVGSTVTLYGAGFTGTSQVTLCFVPAAYTVVSETQITATVPAGACDGRWRITTSGGTSATDTAFTTTIPYPIDLSTTSGPPGTTITLYGSGFTGTTAVSLCFVPATYTLISENKIVATVPTGACTGRWRITNPNGTGTLQTAYTPSL
jgi:surface antigen